MILTFLGIRDGLFLKFFYCLLEHLDHGRLEVAMQEQMRLFRAQRNFYISGFALFLCLVIRRLVLLISNQAALLAQSEASMRQAQGASTAARTLLAQRGVEEQNSTNEAHDKQVSTKLSNKLRTKQLDRFWNSSLLTGIKTAQSYENSG